MKSHRHRIVAIAFREVRRFAAIAAKRAGQPSASTRKQRPSFRPLTGSEVEALLGGELLAVLSGAREAELRRPKALPPPGSA